MLAREERGLVENGRGIAEVEEPGRVRFRALLGEFDGLLDLALHLVLEPREGSVVEDPGRGEPLREAGHRVLGPDPLKVRRVAVAVRVYHRVAPEAVAQQFEEAGHALRTGLLHRRSTASRTRTGSFPSTRALGMP